jgi:glycosyltransferase involved in cell wall biosynthesis
MNRLSVSVVLTTFNAPDAIRLVLLGLARQTFRPDEVLIADDGSDENLTPLLSRLAPELPFPITHLWQPHQGFRAARSRNNAIFQAHGEVLAFLDQDTVPHGGWLEAHVSRLDPDKLSLGDVILLSEAEAAGLDEASVREGLFEGVISDANRRRLAALQRRYALYAWLRLAGLPIKAKPRLRSSNFAIPAARLREVNGFDESYVGWGQEDDDLGRRLYRHGVRPLIRVAAARVSHWPHPPRRPADWTAGANARRFLEGASGPARCEAGLSNHPHPDVRAQSFP